MSTLAISAIVACLLSIPICGLVSSLVFIEIISQVNKAKVAPEISELKRTSIWEMTRVNRLHRQLFPSSKLRKISAALMLLGIAAFFVLISLAITHPGPPSRTSDLKVIKSSR
jgi:hypothetical protein